MAGNSALILAGVAGAGTGGTGLAWFAPTGTAAPADATTALVAAYKDAGIVAESGLTAASAEASTDINGFGLGVPARTLVTSSKTTFAVTFLESNPISLAVYHRKALDAITVDATGAFDFTTGAHSSQRYAAVFDVIDGDNHLRAFCPDVEVTDRGDLSVASSAPIQYPVTLTAYQGTDGVAIHWFYVLGALAT
jgi:hypothetical protein